MKQKDIFKSTEGNKYFERNMDVLNKRDYSKNLIVKEIAHLIDDKQADNFFNNEDKVRLLEIGCGDGGMLEYLQNNYNIDCYGIDPSDKAIEKTKARGVRAKIGTADKLDFNDNTFDIIHFGFCLYLCDREDLFAIAKEANRVNKNKSIIIMEEFYSQNNVKNKYSHQDNIFSFKMDYRNLFTWHPYYVTFKHMILHHKNHQAVNLFTDKIDEWVSIAILRKNKDFINK